MVAVERTVCVKDVFRGRPFAAHIRKSFRKIRAFCVGSHAEALLDAGKRLTVAEQSPREFDLTRE